MRCALSCRYETKIIPFRFPTRLVIGKIALVISAIIGLKKLVAPEGHEKTTYEIVKHPHVQQSHSYSSSHGEYDGHEGTGQYHRSFGEYEEMLNSPVFRKSS